ncbi:SDR family NAD(P)-dependent oxidoreductase [Massilia forsythiae]|uniref:SDR family NAD(P)-dependent oxidoreductase n=1 Tax=Massilia forsythiae TaxID=2728020 RepID=A0A7Z2VTR4_9BURK|nr:SDR family NAD(P)-dependent oxidoreductase [Massilia forsythiae]QJD99116.1 SDR family NAD(P)-dependent oxidoreductase [Massilia forsythiae]
MQDLQQRIVIIGATSSIAEHCARLWVAGRGVALTLVGRDAARLERVAADLRVRGPGAAVTVRSADFSDPRSIRALADAVVREGMPTQVLIAHGSLPDQQQCQRDLEAASEALDVNGVSPVLFAEAFAGHMEAVGGTITIIGSVAGDRGRRSNYVYGAAKGLVTRYAQGLQHRLAGSGSRLKVVLVKPGPTATPMTAHLPQRGLAPVESVARLIVDGSRAGKPVVYAPGKWALIMMVIRHLPAVVFNKMNI